MNLAEFLVDSVRNHIQRLDILKDEIPQCTIVFDSALCLIYLEQYFHVCLEHLNYKLVYLHILLAVVEFQM